MKKKSPPYAIIGCLILGIVAIILFINHERGVKSASDAQMEALQKQIEELKKTPTAPVTTVTPVDVNVREVYYATRPLKSGDRLSPSFFEKKNTPVDLLPNAVDVKGNPDIVSWYVIHDIEKGDALTNANVGRSLPFAAGRISPGMRLVALPIFNAEYNLTSGYIVDGDRVDLLWTSMSPDGKDKIDTQFVMQNVSVFSIPGLPPELQTDKSSALKVTPPPGDPISVAFEVTPEQAQALILMQSSINGRFSMILRARTDVAPVRIKPFVGSDYLDNLKKIQVMSDKSLQRVQELQKQLDALQKQGPGNSNETTTPPPTP